MLRIYAVELAAELGTGLRLPTGEYTPPDTTQLDSTCSVFNIFLPNPSAVVVSCICEFNRRRRHAPCIALYNYEFLDNVSSTMQTFHGTITIK